MKMKQRMKSIVKVYLKMQLMNFTMSFLDDVKNDDDKKDKKPWLIVKSNNYLLDWV